MVMNKLKITPLSKIMGAEISGIDLRHKIENSIINQIIQAISDYLVICIKNQKLTPKQLVEVSKLFGKPKKYFVTDETYKNVPEVIIVTNRSKINQNKPQVYASHWHTDDSYMKNLLH